ncbi:hypothetical protein Sango_2359200 [Sesamum angolense]|uniref:Uncharacterized protein n=1 Tax=Sesamum angolense TaxID=2727404 RepID=A0AAE1W693_9LAMI|nr:hypothetical protein Sango_2359200 [Sesamum angolense]
MRDEEAQKPWTSPTSTPAASFSTKKDGSVFEGVCGRGRYKLWALGAIFLLAVWSMFTGSVTLKSSAVNIKHPSRDLGSPSMLDGVYLFWVMFMIIFCLKRVKEQCFEIYSKHWQLTKGMSPDVEEREKMVRQMWNAYKHSSAIRLPSFWRDAFGAAYQDLTSEVASVRDAALSEIAKMSFRSRDVYEPPPVQTTVR